MSICTIVDCTNPVYYRRTGWCKKHHARWERHGDPLKLVRVKWRGVSCTVDGCDTSVLARGWCGKHYKRWEKYGDPDAKVHGAHDQGRGSGFVTVRSARSMLVLPNSEGRCAMSFLYDVSSGRRSLIQYGTIEDTIPRRFI